MAKSCPERKNPAWMVVLGGSEPNTSDPVEQKPDHVEELDPWM